jgi:two-component system chemotaxis response regulator CheB
MLVDDSPLALAVIKRMLVSSPDIQVVGTAANGREALKLIPELQPAVICTDLMMPEMDGLELTREVMARFPRPILVISSTVRSHEPRSSYPVLEAGALEVAPKPAGETGIEYDRLTRELVSKIRILAGVRVFRRPAGVEAAPLLRCAEASRSPQSREPNAGAARVVVIGASTGGPMALRTILGALPRDYPLPVLCVQHISNGFLEGFLEWLGAQCRLQLRVGLSGEQPAPGAVYFPPESQHLELDSRGGLRISQKPPVDGHRPSVTAAMRSAAQCHGGGAAGVLLTGMGRDGADGLAEIARAGGLTVAQDEASCVVFGMPKEAIALHAARHVLPPPEIAKLLCSLRPAGSA